MSDKILIVPESGEIIESGAYAGRGDVECVVVSEGVVEIGDEAFAFCDGLLSVTLPSTLKRIGKSAFQECVNLSKINLPQGIEEIGEAAFCNCLALPTPTVGCGVLLGELAFHHTKKV